MKHVNKYLTSLALTAGFVSAPVMAEGLDAKNLYVGGGISENVVDSPFGGGSDDAFGYTLFAGYEFQNSYPLVKTSAEIGALILNQTKIQVHTQNPNPFLRNLYHKPLPPYPHPPHQPNTSVPQCEISDLKK